MSDREQFLRAWQAESPTTARVLQAFPPDQEDMKPHEKSRTALELANTMVNGAVAIRLAASGTWSIPPQFPPPATSWAEVVAAFERESAATTEAVARASDEMLANATVAFLSGPQTPADLPAMRFLWFILMDGIHHRGQFSVYLRMVGGHVPSIYGPTADEPWT